MTWDLYPFPSLPGTHRPVRTVHTAQLALSPPPVPEWCVQGLFARPSLNLLVGDPGSKKSLTAIDLAVCVALGKPWLACPVEQKPVLLIDEEAGLHRLWKRLNSALTAHQAPPETPLHFITLGGYDFRVNADILDLTQQVQTIGPGLVIIDALADVMRGGDENSVPAVHPILYELRRLAEDCRTAIVIIHHNNKQGAFRGSSSISAAVDHMLAIVSPPAESLIRISTLKSRDVSPITLHARAHREPDRFWLAPAEGEPTPPTILPPQLSPSAHRVLNFLAQRGQATTSQLMAEISENTPGAIRNLIHHLVVGGYLIRVDGRSRGAKATFELTVKGIDYVNK